MDAVTAVCFAVLGVSGLLCLRPLLRAVSLADRIIALDSLLIVVVVGVAVDAARTGSGAFLDVLLVVALVAFIGTVAAARFVEHRGAR